MTINPKVFFGLIAMGMIVGACNRKGADDLLLNDQLSTSRAQPEDRFGQGFGQAYRADPKSEPRIVGTNDVVAVSPTAEPVMID